MAKVAETQLIASSLLGTDLTESDCEVLSEIVKQRDLTEGEVLFEPETVDGNLYILIEGKLEIIKVMGPNKRIQFNTLKAGSLIGELSFIDGNAHTMQLKARTPAKVLYVQRDDFERLSETHPKVGFNVMRSILRYSHNLQRQMVQDSIQMQRMLQNEYMN